MHANEGEVTAVGTGKMERELRAALAVASALQAACPELCQLDSIAGDGDHGLAMAGAGRRIQEKLATDHPATLVELLQLSANEFAGAGGSMGAICYVFLQSVAEQINSGLGPVLATCFVRALEGAEQAVGAFGGAQIGDKTVLDAISAAREALSARTDAKSSVADCLKVAADGARRGAEHTAGMAARVGRASRLGEASRGSVDPGAMSFAIALQALAGAFTTDKTA